jgi:hypothetical protein
MHQQMSQSNREPIPPDLVAALLAIEPLLPRLQVASVIRIGSQARSDARARVGRNALELAVAALAGGVEHLEVWRVLALRAGHLPPFSYMTLLRASMEGVVLARWLLEPRISPDERRARGLGAQWADYAERRKFERQRGMGKPRRGKRAAERMQDIENQAKRLGLTIRRPPDRTRLFELYALPSAERREDSFGAELYRVWSGAPHGRQWTMPMTARHEVVGGQPAGMRPLARLTIDTNTAAASTQIAVGATIVALMELEAYTQAPRPSR